MVGLGGDSLHSEDPGGWALEDDHMAHGVRELESH